MHKFIITAASVLFCFSKTVTAQNNNLMFIELANGDSIHCSSIEHNTTNNGRLKYLKYTSTEGKTFEYKGRNKVPKLSSFRHHRQTYEMVPRRLYNPKKRNIVAKRLVDGKISYCYFNNEKWESGSRIVNSGSGSHMQSTTTKTGFKLRYIKNNDGSYYQLTKKSMKRKLKPFLKKCEAFNKSYTGEFKVNFMGTGIVEMLKLYNESCKD